MLGGMEQPGVKKYISLSHSYLEGGAPRRLSVDMSFERGPCLLSDLSARSSPGAPPSAG